MILFVLGTVIAAAGLYGLSPVAVAAGAVLALVGIVLDTM